MPNNYLCLLGAIDSLWFHQTIFFPEPISLLDPKSTETPQDSITNSSFTYPTSSLVSLAVADEEMSSSFSTLLEPEISSPGTPYSPDMSTPQEDQRKRSTSLDIVANRLKLIRSQSSSSPTSNDQRSPRKNRRSGLTTRKLEKSMSMRSLGELELEELKGLMDLGFTFKKENINPRMMSLVPGLQRLRVGAHSNNKKTQNSSDDDDVEELANKDNDHDGGDDEVEVEVTRPYLSEAWLIKRPDSPLLNLRLPTRVSSAADMKKHLKSWARTVASEIEQES